MAEENLRAERFEQMLFDIQQKYAEITLKMDTLRAEGKTKTVTYRELMGNKLLCQQMLTLYRLHGLID